MPSILRLKALSAGWGQERARENDGDWLVLLGPWEGQGTGGLEAGVPLNCPGPGMGTAQGFMLGSLHNEGLQAPKHATQAPQAHVSCPYLVKIPRDMPGVEVPAWGMCVTRLSTSR